MWKSFKVRKIADLAFFPMFSFHEKCVELKEYKYFCFLSFLFNYLVNVSFRWLTSQVVLFTWIRSIDYCSSDYLAVDIYLFKVKKENTIAMCEICSDLTIKTLERR